MWLIKWTLERYLVIIIHVCFRILLLLLLLFFFLSLAACTQANVKEIPAISMFAHNNIFFLQLYDLFIINYIFRFYQMEQIAYEGPVASEGLKLFIKQQLDVVSQTISWILFFIY